MIASEHYADCVRNFAWMLLLVTACVVLAILLIAFVVDAARIIRKDDRCSRCGLGPREKYQSALAYLSKPSPASDAEQIAGEGSHDPRIDRTRDRSPPPRPPD